MVAGRFPSSGRGDPLALPAGLGRGVPPTAEAALAEERRLCYVAMTRARDELHPVARRRLRRRPGAARLAVRARGARPAGRRRASRAPAPATSTPRRAAGDVRAVDGIAAGAPDGPITEPLSLSFYQIDDYLTCPLKYKYAHVLRVPLAPHHAIVYGAALHKAVQLFHHRHAKGHVMSEAELDEVFESAWSNEGFMSRDHEEARLAAGRAALRRFRAAQLEPDAVIPTYVEREFSFTLGGDRVRGRWDRVDVVPIEAGERRAGSSHGRTTSADVVSPTLGILGPGAGDDHRLQVVRRARPGQGAPARPRVAPAPDLRDGLRGDDRPAARRASRCTSSSPASSARSTWTRSGWPRPASGSPGGGRDAGPRLHAEARTTSPARTARSATSARPASPADAGPSGG